MSLDTLDNHKIYVNWLIPPYKIIIYISDLYDGEKSLIHSFNHLVEVQMESLHCRHREKTFNWLVAIGISINVLFTVC